MDSHKRHDDLLSTIRVHPGLKAVSGERPFNQLKLFYRQGVDPSTGKVDSTHIEIRDKDGFRYFINARAHPDRIGCHISGQLMHMENPDINYTAACGSEALTLLNELMRRGPHGAGSLKMLALRIERKDLIDAFRDKPMPPKRQVKSAPKLQHA